MFSLGLSLSCGGQGSYVWYKELPAGEWYVKPARYVIAVGDSVQIRVYDQENLSFRGKIRADGLIDLPLVGEVAAAGKQPAALARELEGRLRAFIVNPHVTVNVEDTQPTLVSVLGEVNARGTLSLAPPANLSQALAQAGGLTEFAAEDSIFVMRQAPVFRRIRFSYEAVKHNYGGAAAFPLKSGDLIVVE